MTEHFVICSRCGELLVKCEWSGGTAGYYRGPWPSATNNFLREGETLICDYCMWLDPKYVAAYGSIK